MMPFINTKINYNTSFLVMNKVRYTQHRDMLE